MIFGDFNTLFLFFILIFLSLLMNNNNALNLLLIAELLWITLYFLALLIGLKFNNLNILSLTFFFLVFSAIELGIGLILLLTQTILNRSTSLAQNDSTFPKFASQITKKLYLTRIQWKI